ncbi:branched-chain amino acid ABC transporter permease [Cryobacterium sp. BB736]|uniref:ABC transporter permease subunit n=1 Tax=Cryobacterium sp. BB736 TaxID=2746963 RepID=UPI00351C96F5
MLFAAVFAAITLSTFVASPALADEVGTDEYDFIFSGNVKFEDKPLADVRITVEGGGYDAEVVTGEDGRWRVGVPDKDETYTITLDEETLPKGVIVAEGSATKEAEFGLTNNATVNFFLGEGVRQVTPFSEQLAGRIMNGLNFGLMLALASIGLSLIFGTTGISNFAHAEMVTFGALMALTFGVHLAFPMWIAIPIAVILAGLFGLAQDIGLWKPMRKRGLSVVQLMIISIGLSLGLRYVYLFFYGGGVFQLPNPGSTKIQLLGPIKLSITDMISMGVSLAVLIGVAYWLINTRTGKATRAISDNASLAAASGINVDRVVRIIWILGSALAGLSGVLWAYFRPGIRWDMGWQILLLIFAAVVLGGLGTAFGALLGSIIVGLMVEVSTLWLPSDIKYVSALTVLIVVLLFRPQGILGRRERIG